MISIISKQTREKSNRQRQRYTRKNKTNRQQQQQQKKHRLCTHQIEPTFGDRK